jgi:hypothetical protein
LQRRFYQNRQKHRIPAELIEQVRIWLCNTACLYDQCRQKPVPRQSSFRKIKQELSALEKLGRRLTMRLRCLSDGAVAWFDIAEEATTQEMLADGDPITTSSFGHHIYRQQDPNGRKTTTFLRLDQIIEAVSVLPEVIARLIAVLEAKSKGGRPSNQAMWLFVTQLRDMWRIVFPRRKFTFNPGKGNSATQLCWDLLRLIDPHASQPEFHTAMRKIVKARVPRTGSSSKRPKPRKPASL